MPKVYPLADVTRALFALLWWGLWAPMFVHERFMRVLALRVPRVADNETRTWAELELHGHLTGLPPEQQRRLTYELTWAELELHGHLMGLPPEQQRRLTYELFAVTFRSASHSPASVERLCQDVERLCHDEDELWQKLTDMVAQAGYGRPSSARLWAKHAHPERTADRAKAELFELLRPRHVDKLRGVLGIVAPGEIPAPPGSPAVNKIVADTAAAEASAAAETSAGGA